MQSRVSIGLDHMVRPVVQGRLTSVALVIGWRLVLVDDPVSWLNDHPNGLILVASTRSSADMRRLRNLAPQATIVFVVEDCADSIMLRRCLSAGASGVVAANQSVVALECSLRAALAGLAVLPTDVAVAFAGHLEEFPTGLELSSREEQILALLATGASLDEIATAVGHSERHMRRIMARLLVNINARNRHHAAAKAARWGLE